MTVSLPELLGEANRRTRGHRELLVFPLVAAALQVSRIRNVLADPADIRAGIAFPFPSPLTDVWSFTSRAGDGVNFAAPEPPFLFVYPFVLVVMAAMMAAYVGSLDDVLRGSDHDAIENLLTYFVPFAVFVVLTRAASLAVAGAGLGLLAARAESAALLFVLMSFVGFAVLGYLFYATPFLFVIEDRGVVSAFRRSAELAAAGGDYAWFFVQHLVVGIFVSIPMAVLVHNVPVVGIAVGAVVGAYLGLVFTGATLLFLRRHVGASDDEVAPDQGVAPDDGTAPGETESMPTADDRSTVRY